MSQKARSIFSFVCCTSGIYFCHLVCGVIYEKIFKTTYENSLTHGTDYYNLIFPLVFMTSLMSTIIGYLCVQDQSIPIPYRKVFIFGMMDVGGVALSNLAIMSSSYLVVTMVHTCGLFSVILVGIFFSGVTDRKLKIGHQKLLIGGIVCLGIVIFNYYTDLTGDGVNKPVGIISGLLLLGCLICQGFKADVQAQIKSQYSPSAYQMYYSLNFAVMVLALAATILTFQMPKFISFIYYHDSFIFDIMLLSLLGSFGDIFIYRLIKSFKQYVVPFVVLVRKFITIGMSMVIFGHRINQMQIIGILVVFCGVLVELLHNYYSKSQDSFKSEIPRKIDNCEQNDL